MTVKTNKSAPITRHPAFPLTIALWFAALFGMGSLLLQPAILESLVVTIHLDRLIPAATPPLGFTARTLVAVLLALAGGIAGFALGRRLGAGGASSGKDAGEAGRARKARGSAPAGAEVVAMPAAPADPDLGDDNDDLARLEAARDNTPTRRRGLNSQLVIDPFAPPAAGSEPAILNLGELTAIEPISASTSPEAAWPSTATTDALPPMGAEVGTPAETAVSAEPRGLGLAPPPSLASTAMPPADPAPAASTPAAPRFVRRRGTAAKVLREAPLDTLGVVELVERFALALAARREREAAPAAGSADLAPAFLVTPESPSVAPAPSEPIASRPFDMPAAAQMSAPPSPAEWCDSAERSTPELEAAVDDPIDHAEAGHLRSLEEGGWALPDLDDEPDLTDLDDDLAESGMDAGTANLSPAPFAKAPAAASDDQAFSSLLAMKPSARPAPPTPVTADDPTGESLGNASPEATEAALRKALATLQRMSGAA